MEAPNRPTPSEYAPYYERYIGLVPDGSALEHLRSQIGETLELLRSVSEEKSNYRYAPGKWSVKEVVGHLADSERVFAYRALRFARSDQTPLSGFDENDYTTNSNFADRPLGGVAEEFRAVRTATIALFEGMSGEAVARQGTANDTRVSVRALLWIIAGHERHHRKILQERYL